jgi:hypothetical protein
MSSALAQTLIGGGLAILGGLIAAWWQISRSDDVAQRIRRAERYESALIELNAQVAKAASQVGEVWGAHPARLRRLRQGQTDASEYDLVDQPLTELLNHWTAVSSPIISDNAIVAAFANLHAERATHMWHEGSLAYSGQPPQNGKIDTTQLLQDLEAVYVAVTEVSTQTRSRVAALHDGPHQPLLRRVSALSPAAKRKNS